MTRKLFKLLFIPFLILIYFSPLVANDYETREQTPAVASILKAETRVKESREIIDIINRIDTTYGDLYENLKEKKQLVIFFDPAHGKLPNGEWQGGKITHRLSCTGRPEEYYSIQLSQKLYKKLKDNPHIVIKSTEDYLKVLEGESDVYNNIPFSRTVAMAREAQSFIIISEHLNNVSMSYKASGKANIPGIHITIDGRGRKILKYVADTYSGFLTLYNELDSSGFSRTYALNLKKRLEEDGLKPNSWEFGAVGDDRFSYFVDFPISVIYESGFISNPEEEKKLSDPEYQNTIVEAQYEMLLETIRDVFSVDISGRVVSSTGKTSESRMELLKLSRIAVYYTKNGETSKAINTIAIMEKKYSSGPYSGYIGYFRTIRKRIQNAEYNFNRGLANSKKKHYKTARRYYRRARNSINYAPIYSAYQAKYSRYLGSRRTFKEDYEARLAETPPIIAIQTQRSPRWKPVILAIDEGQSLRDALYNALEADDKTIDRLMKSMVNARSTEYKKVRYYSKKHKSYRNKWEKTSRRVTFHTGIYVLQIDKNLNVSGVKRVSSIHLRQDKYQNQQYLKNSYFASESRVKDL